MAFEYKRLSTVQALSIGVAAIFTNLASKTSFIRVIQIFNESEDSATITLYNVPNNATSISTTDATNMFYKVVVLTNETIIIGYDVPSLMLDGENDTIQGYSSESYDTIEILGGQE